ncbi:MAG: helix-hairpin-helix domain-containing protein [Anaerolineales bacterium]
MPDHKVSNEEIADLLDHIAELLEAQDANVHRVRAYRNGASSVRHAQGSLADMVKKGDEDKLQDLPDVGEGLARIITTYVQTGRSNLLDRLKGEVDPQALFVQVPGIGDKLAQRISNQLDVNTLEGLERAAHDGRLEEIEGFGEKRVQSVRVSLAGMLSRSGQRRARQRVEDGGDEDQEEPSVKTLLSVDAEYRKKAQKGELRTIAPKRFNPENKAWLPILNTERKGWDFTALYSNTARAHDLGTTHDWVVIYYERDSQESQATVVTKKGGAMDGKRVVRGREVECMRYYEDQGEI